MKQVKRAFLAVVVLLCGATFGSVEAQTLKTTKLPDGTGTVGLPPGWKIVSAYRGSVDCVGPQGALVRLGIPWAITLPIDPVTGWATTAAGQAPMAQTGDIPTALQQVLLYHGKARLTRLSRRPARSAVPGMPAAMLSYDFTAGGKTFTSVGYFSALSYGQDSSFWSLYSSVVVAPKPVFWKMFPTMVKIWGSWRANGKAPEAGSASALVDGIIKQKWASAEKQNLYFREYILGNPK